MAFAVTMYGTPLYWGTHATVSGLILTNVSYNSTSSKSERRGTMGRMQNVTYYDEGGTWSADADLIADDAETATGSDALALPSTLVKGARLTAIETGLPDGLFASAATIATIDDVNTSASGESAATVSLSGSIYCDLPTA